MFRAPGVWCTRRNEGPQHVTQNYSASGTLMRSIESVVEKEEPEFEVDFRIGGIAQDVIREDEKWDIIEELWKLRIGSRTQSVI